MNNSGIEINSNTVHENKSERISRTFTLSDEKKLFQVEKKDERNLIELSGECLYNFNDKKHILFSDVITYSEATDELKDEARKKLQECEEIFNSSEIPWNFVLMPVQEALNNVVSALSWGVTT